MLHLALAALLAGSPGPGAAIVSAETDKDETPRTEAAVGIASDDAITLDTYAYGQPEPTFLNVWAGFGWARVDGFYDQRGDEQTSPEATAMRAFFGAQLNLIRTEAFNVGVGGQIMLGSQDVDGVGDTGFGMHSLKLFGEVKGRALGVHGGYILDLGDEIDPEQPGIHLTDGLDAFFVGASFDYQPAWFRLFAGIDYFQFIDHPGFDGTGWDSPSLLVFHLGTGFDFDVVEVGVAALMRTNRVHSAIGPRGGSHQGSLAPYINLNFLPVGISIRGAVFGDYADYGFSIGGAGDLVTQLGFTAALTWGF